MQGEALDEATLKEYARHACSSFLYYDRMAVASALIDPTHVDSRGTFKAIEDSQNIDEVHRMTLDYCMRHPRDVPRLFALVPVSEGFLADARKRARLTAFHRLSDADKDAVEYELYRLGFKQQTRERVYYPCTDYDSLPKEVAVAVDHRLLRQIADAPPVPSIDADLLALKIARLPTRAGLERDLRILSSANRGSLEISLDPVSTSKSLLAFLAKARPSLREKIQDTLALYGVFLVDPPAYRPCTPDPPPAY
jgi:hypothetical protein